MDFYVIPPTSDTVLMHSGDRYFCLAQLYLNNKEYKKFFLDLPPEAWVTLDNGAGDHDLVTEDQLFEVLKELTPNEVIPPDVLFNSSITSANAYQFYERMVEEGLSDDTEIFYCPQGKTQQDWLANYSWALEQDWIKTIGMSKIAVPFAWLGVKGDVGIMEARHNCFNYLKVHELFKKPIHLLGMGDPREFAYYRQFAEGSFIRSTDSCNSIWSAINELDWTADSFHRIPTPKDYFTKEQLTADQRVIFENNVDFLNESVA